MGAGLQNHADADRYRDPLPSMLVSELHLFERLFSMRIDLRAIKQLQWDQELRDDLRIAGVRVPGRAPIFTVVAQRRFAFCFMAEKLDSRVSLARLLYDNKRMKIELGEAVIRSDLCHLRLGCAAETPHLTR